MARIERLTTPNVGKYVEQLELSYIAGGEGKMVQPHWKTLEDFLIKINKHVLIMT